MSNRKHSSNLSKIMSEGVRDGWIEDERTKPAAQPHPSGHCRTPPRGEPAKAAQKWTADVRGDGEGHFFVEDSEGNVICNITRVTRDGEQEWANAELIAAAPETAAELERVKAERDEAQAKAGEYLIAGDIVRRSNDELLAACKVLTSWQVVSNLPAPVRHDWEALQAAIAKAEGRAS